MSKAIKIHLTKAEGEYDLGTSKLFGAPTIPTEWADKFDDSIIFFGQIRLLEIAELDTENRLPHSGYLYLFLNTESYNYTAQAEYYDGEPDMVVDDFNELDEEYAHLTQAYLMSFEEADEDCDGTRLFGVPLSEPDEDGELLMQFDPLDESTGFLEEIDGYGYFYFGKGKNKLSGIRFVIDRS